MYLCSKFLINSVRGGCIVPKPSSPSIAMPKTERKSTQIHSSVEIGWWSTHRLSIDYVYVVHTLHYKKSDRTGKLHSQHYKGTRIAYSPEIRRLWYVREQYNLLLILRHGISTATASKNDLLNCMRFESRGFREGPIIVESCARRNHHR